MSTIRANSITNSAGTGAPDFPNGVSVGGSAVTATAAELNILDGITAIASQAEAQAGTSSTTLMTPQRAKQAIDALVGAANAGLAYGAVGTYAYLGTINTIAGSTTMANPGDLFSGSSLQAIGPYAIEGTPGYSQHGAALSGTWRTMGFMRNVSTSARKIGTVFLRVA